MVKNLIFKIYSFLSTLIENSIFKNSNSFALKNDLFIEGFQSISVTKPINIDTNENELIKVNPYLAKIRLSEKQINDFVQKVFVENNVADYLFKNTGFNYYIIHITAYETEHIPENDSKKSFYANQWHKDGPYSKNTLKIILPLTDINNDNGAMQICSISNSRKISKYLFNSNISKEYSMFESKKLEKIFIFNPHLCFHRAGNPKKTMKRRQLVFQINPSFSWSHNAYLYETQLMMEPKFPLFNNKLSNKIKLKLD
tara:strand:- start:2747 stop:3514 length:768 start_codon:yes stop_codon:yes gene_type:complete